MTVKGHARSAADAVRRLGELRAQGVDVPLSDSILGFGRAYLELSGEGAERDGTDRLAGATKGQSGFFVTSSRFVVDHPAFVGAWPLDQVRGLDDPYTWFDQSGFLGQVGVSILSTTRLDWLVDAMRHATGQTKTGRACQPIISVGTAKSCSR